METTLQDEKQLSKEEVFQGVKEAKNMFNILGGFCLGGFIVFMLSVFLGNLPNNIWFAGLLGLVGYVIIALPCIMMFVLKTGLFVNVGPMFYESQTRIGNIIYIRNQRDVNSQMAANIGFTLIKAILIGIVSLVLTPIVTLVSYLAYKKRYKNAVEYSKANDIDYSKLPVVNKKVVLAGILVVAVLFVGAIIADKVSSKILDDKLDDKSNEATKLLNTVIEDTKLSYVAKVANLSDATVGEVAEFEMDGAKIYAGDISNGYDLKFKEIDNTSKYFIVEKDGNTDIYINIYDTSNPADWKKYSKDDNKDLYEYLMAKYLSSRFGKGAKYKNSLTKEGENQAFVYTYNSKDFRMFVDKEGKLVKVYSKEYQFDSYLIPDFNASLDDYKETLSEIIK